MYLTKSLDLTDKTGMSAPTTSLYSTKSFGVGKEPKPCTFTRFFEAHEIRRVFDDKTEIWWFSVVDIIQVLAQQTDYQTACKYWNKLKERLGKEGSQSVTNCNQLNCLPIDCK